LLWPSFNPRIIESLRPWELFGPDVSARALGLGILSMRIRLSWPWIPRVFVSSIDYNPVPIRAVYNIIMKFRTRGTVLNWYHGCGRMRTGRSEEHRQQVQQLIREGTPTSLRNLARILGVYQLCNHACD
jgi:hypothetical protein